MDDKLHLEKIKSEIIDLAKEYFQINKNDVFIPNISSVPVSGKVLDENDLINTILSSLDMWYTAGDFTKQFEIIFETCWFLETFFNHLLFV